MPDAPLSLAFLDELTPPQREAATADGPVLVLAGAGTGKTKTLTAAVAWRAIGLKVPPRRIMAVTFTNKAAAEMIARIGRLLGGDTPSWIGTFHGLASRMLREVPEVAGLRPNFDILDADDARRVLKRVMKNLGMSVTKGGGEEGGGSDPIKAMEKRVGWFKDNAITPEQAAEVVRQMVEMGVSAIDALELEAAARLYPAYQRSLREGNAADFGDLLLWTTVAMQSSEEMRRRWAGRFDCTLADEYQDVNMVQWLWLKLLSSDHRRLFVVGDDDQSIYSWRSSEIRFIRDFAEEYPDATVIRLEQNFRSTTHILDAANAVIEKDPERLGKTLFSNLGEGAPVEVLRFWGGAEEADAIVEEMRRRQREGARWDDFAVLYRYNFLSRQFEEALTRARIPYTLVGDVAFWERAEIKDSLALLRLASNWGDTQSDEAFRRVANVPKRGLGDKAMDAIEREAVARGVPLCHAARTAPLPPKARAALGEFLCAVESVVAETEREATLADQMSMLLERTGYAAALRDSRAEDAPARLENLAEVITATQSYDSARDLFDTIALRASKDEEDQGGRVRLMTVFAAKGLEFPHVFLPGWDDGLFPSPRGNQAEERRLAYVALTRAMRRCSVSSVEFRRGGSSAPSTFLRDIPREHAVSGWLRDVARPAVARPPQPRNLGPNVVDIAGLLRRL